MKKINTKTELKDFKGEVMKGGEESVTVGVIVSNILAGKVSNPHRGYMLAKKFATEDVVELKAEDIVFIKEELEANGKAKDHGYNSIVIGQVIEVLDGATDEDTSKK